MARKNYSDEFRRQAVDLYESTPGATVRGIAADLGIVRGTLRQWLEAHGTGKKIALDGTSARSPLGSTRSPRAGGGARDGERPEQELIRLRALVDELEVETTKPSMSGWLGKPRQTGPTHHTNPPWRTHSHPHSTAPPQTHALRLTPPLVASLRAGWTPEELRKVGLAALTKTTTRTTTKTTGKTTGKATKGAARATAGSKGDPGSPEAENSPEGAGGEGRSWLRGTAGVLTPHVPASGAPVAADRDDQRGGSPPERFVGQSTSHGVTCGPFGTAASAPPLVGVGGFHDATGRHRPLRLESLSGHDESERVETAEGGQVSGVEPSNGARADGNVRHVEVFQMGSVRTSILGRPRPQSRRDAPNDAVHDGVTRPHP